uniref:Uncharacterized protein n=1 Tax=Heterorhabditis bacteriophora TaxID=37862 RepID=A0A1I7WC81_HETBA
MDYTVVGSSLEKTFPPFPLPLYHLCTYCTVATNPDDFINLGTTYPW